MVGLGWLVVRCSVGGLLCAAVLSAVEGRLSPVLADQVYLRCDVSGPDRTVWEITLDEEAGKAWIYKPAFRSITEHSATFTPEKVRFGKQLPHTGSYLSNVLGRSSGALTSEIHGLGAPPMTGICGMQANTTPMA